MVDYSDITKMFTKKKNAKKVFEIVDFISGEENGVIPENIVKFYRSYSQTLYNKDKSSWNEPPIFSLGEKLNRKTLPLITEFEFSFSDKNKRNQLDEQLDQENFALHVIGIHHQLIKEFCVLSFNQSEFLCVYSKSRLVRHGNKIVMRARFQFPYCVVKKSFLANTFRKRLLESLERLDTDEMFYLTPLYEETDNEWDNYILPVKEIYPLIGSTDDKKYPPLMFDSIYGQEDNDEVIEYEIYSSYELENHSLFSEEYISDEKIGFPDIEDEDDDKYEVTIVGLPIFLSIFFWNEEMKLREPESDEEVEPTVENISTVTSLEKTEDEYDDITDFEIFLDLVDMLSPKRFNTEMYLLDIGKCLFNLFNGSFEGLQHWITYVKEKSKKFDEDFCHVTYPEFGIDNFTSVKTVGWYAREDNLQQYREWHEKYCEPKMKKSISRDTFPHVLVAQAFHRFFWLDYVCAGKKSKQWYRFKGHSLRETSEESIRRDITDKFIGCYDHYRAKYIREKAAASQKSRTSENAKSMTRDFEQIIKVIGQLIDRLQSNHYRSALMTTIKEYFHDETFYDKINVNPSLLGTFNCVIELTSNGAFPRSGKPEDYVTKQMGVSYRSEYDYNNRDVKDVLQYLRQVFPIKEVFEFVKKDIAAMLYGRNSEKFFRMWIGETNGSKSIFQMMLKRMFGDYYRDLPNEYYSGTRTNPSGPSPELAQLPGARIIFSTEPDAGINFRADKIKLITGGDSTFGRACNENGGSINPSYNAVIVMNRIPNISNLDEATKERCVMIPYEGRWLKEEEEDDDMEVPETLEEQLKKKLYRRDKHFEKQVPRLAMALLWLSVEYYTIYKRDGHDKPRYMVDYAADYWRSSDPYLCFIDEFIIKITKEVNCKRCGDNPKDDCKRCKGSGIRTVRNKEKKIKTKDVFPIFKKWLRSSDHYMKCPTQGQFTREMSTRDKLGKQEKWYWLGYILKDTEDDSDSDEE
jgi:phage/plasmid-associated DNA primase